MFVLKLSGIQTILAFKISFTSDLVEIVQRNIKDTNSFQYYNYFS